VDTRLNIKGKKLQLYREIRKGLSEEQCALRAVKAEPRYEINGSESHACMETTHTVSCTGRREQVFLLRTVHTETLINTQIRRHADSLHIRSVPIIPSFLFLVLSLGTIAGKARPARRPDPEYPGHFEYSRFQAKMENGVAHAEETRDED
jgi:hypothetical protein